jgi:hypothetical protein
MALTFAEWVRQNWGRKIEVRSGDYQGDPNSEDSGVSDFGIVPALLFDTSDGKFYLNTSPEGNWEEVGSGSESGITSDNFLEGSGIRIYPSKGSEGEKLQISSEGKLKVTEGDDELDTLDEKLRIGEGLVKYRQKAKGVGDSESLEVSLDDESRQILNNLKYREYIQSTERHRANTVYVNSTGEPYASVRDGSFDRPYLTIKEALESEQVQRGDCTVFVYSGLYIEEAPLELPPRTSLIGEELRRVRVYPTTDTCGATHDRNGGGTNLFEVTHDCIIRNMTVRGVVEPGFTLGFRKNADLKTISPYIQNVTSYNDGRDVHQLFKLELTKAKGKLIPRESSDLVESNNVIKAIPKDDRHPTYDPNETNQPLMLEVDGRVNHQMRLAVGRRYRFSIDPNTQGKTIRFTSDLSNFEESDLVTSRSPSYTELDLRGVNPNDLNLYYQIENNNFVDGEVKLYNPNTVYDNYLFRPGDKIEEIDVDPIPLNLERGDQIYLGDPRAVPFSLLRQSLEKKTKVSSINIEPSKENIPSGSRLYISNQEKRVVEMVVSSEVKVGDTSIDVENPRVQGDPLFVSYSFTQGSTIHYQHPLFTELFVLTENASKGSTKLKVGKFHKIAESNYVAYQLEERTKDPDNDVIELLNPEDIDRTYVGREEGSEEEGEELWFEEIRNDRPTDNQFMVRLKRNVEPGDTTMKVTNAYCKKSQINDLLHVKTLRPLPGEDHNEEDRHECQSYIRPWASVRKDPWQRRNGGGGAHVDGFRLDPRTRLSFDPPKSRLMQFNDYTQVNLNGYGILCEGIANAECVSVFTYFTNNGLYSRNGGEIRALNCSNGFGVYGVKAEGYLGQDKFRTPDNTPEITAKRIWIGHTYTKTLEGQGKLPKEPGGSGYEEAGESISDDRIINNYAVIEDPVYNPTNEVVRADPKVGALIRIDDGSKPVEILTVSRFVTNDGTVYIKVLVNPSWESIQVSSPNVISPFGNLEDESDTSGVYEFRSVVRMTSHDFGYIGTGTRLPRNVGGSGTLVPENVAKRVDFGQVFYSASDEKGNFLVGPFFSVDQATGAVSFSTERFSLTNVEELGPFTTPLGSVGVKVNEVSDNTDLSSDRPDVQEGEPGPNTVPTQTAVKRYVDRRAGPIIQVDINYSASSLVTLNGRSFGSIQVLRGMTYRFNLSANAGVDIASFRIVDENGDDLGEEDGVFNNGLAELTSVSGKSVLFTVPFNAPPKLFYRIGASSIKDPDEGKSTLYVRNPDIRFPQGNREDPEDNIGAVQYFDLNEAGKPVFAGNSNIYVFGNTLNGIFQGSFFGDGSFLRNVPLEAGLNDLENVDLGITPLEGGDILSYFPGSEDEEAEWRRARASIKAYLFATNPNDPLKLIPVNYTYKEGTPEGDYEWGLLDFTFKEASYLIGMI